MNVWLFCFSVCFDRLYRNLSKCNLKLIFYYISLFNPFILKKRVLIKNNHICSVDLMCGISKPTHHFNTMLKAFLNKIFYYRFFNYLSIMTNNCISTNQNIPFSILFFEPLNQLINFSSASFLFQIKYTKL